MVIIKISELTELTTPASGDELPIRDVSEPIAADQTKRITFSNLVTAAITAAIAAIDTIFVYRRQGGNAADWTVAGTTNYTPAAAKIQAGIATLTILVGSDYQANEITFPVAFVNKPLIFVAPNGHLQRYRVGTGNISASQFYLSVISDSTVTGSPVSVDISWLAIGEL